MRHTRGSQGAFTLAEMAMVVAILTISVAPFLAVVVSYYRWFHAIAAQADAKAEAEAAAYRIFRRLAATGSCRLNLDNQGLSFPDGSSVRRQGSRLVLTTPHGQQALLSRGLEDFTAIRRDGVLTLHFVVVGPTRPGGALVSHDFFFDYPTSGAGP